MNNPDKAPIESSESNPHIIESFYEGEMTVEFKLNAKDKHTGIEVLYPTPDVYKAIAWIMNDNFIDSENYQIKQAAGAFWQGGSNNLDSDWHLIEFWHPDENTHWAFWERFKVVYQKVKNGEY